MGDPRTMVTVSSSSPMRVVLCWGPSARAFIRLHPRSGSGGFVIELGGVVIRIRILMYPACILKDTRILMYPDVSQTYLTCVLCYIRREYKYLDKLTFCMYCTRIPKESKIHLEYISDTSGYMYLARFLGVTLDTYQDTSGYMYILDSS